MKLFFASQGMLSIRQPVNILVSLQRLKKMDLSWAKETFCDPGAVYLLTKYKEYPYSLREYAEFIQEQGFDYVASMDYPCEPKYQGKKTVLQIKNEERIERTINNARKLIDYIDADKFYPVLQGYTLDEYKRCIELLKSHGLVKNKLAVGSLCIRKNLQRINTILRLVRREFPTVSIHAFGLTNAFLKKKEFWLEHLCDSVDTGAWFHHASHGHIYVFNPLTEHFFEFDPYWKGKRKKISLKDLATLNLKAYMEFFNYYKRKYTQQGSVTLERWLNS